VLLSLNLQARFADEGEGFAVGPREDVPYGDAVCVDGLFEHGCGCANLRGLGADGAAPDGVIDGGWLVGNGGGTVFRSGLDEGEAGTEVGAAVGAGGSSRE
jgi:hypothetical protein